MNSLVIPVYKNEANLDRLLAELVKLAKSVAGEFEVVFVVDGSPDRCLEILRERLPSLPLRTQLLSLSRNFGSFAAIAAGPEGARGGPGARALQQHGSEGGGSSGAAGTDTPVLRGSRLRPGRYRFRSSRPEVGPVAFRNRIQYLLVPLPQTRDQGLTTGRRRYFRMHPRGARSPAPFAGDRFQPDRPPVLARLPPRVHCLPTPAAPRGQERLDVAQKAALLPEQYFQLHGPPDPVAALGRSRCAGARRLRQHSGDRGQTARRYPGARLHPHRARDLVFRRADQPRLWHRRPISLARLTDRPPASQLHRPFRRRARGERSMTGADVKRFVALPSAARTAVWFAILTVPAAVAAYYRIFSGFAEWDDEGTQMMTVRQYLTGGKLYEEIYSGYGPVYFFYNWLVRSATGNVLNHNAVRITSAVVSLLCALLCAWIVLRLTRSLAAASVAPLLFFLVLSFFTYEPGHPQELCMMLLLCLAGSGFLATNPRTRWLGMAAAGSLAAALTLLKVNIGNFPIFAVALAILFQSPPGWFWRTTKYATGGAALLLPFALMRGQLNDPAAPSFG